MNGGGDAKDAACERRLREQEREAAALRASVTEFEAITRSLGWRWLVMARKVRQRLLPRGSRRDRFVRACLGFVRRVRQSPALRSLRRLLPSRSEAHHYRLWIAASEASVSALAAQREAAKGLSCRPRFALIAAGESVGTLTDSLLRQTYPDWELYLPGGDSFPHDLDPRIRRGMPATAGEGDFLLFAGGLRALAPDALFEITRVAAEDPEADLVYFDEDAQDERGRRSDPWFKPDWSPELLLSVNYLRHAAVRGVVLDAVGGWDSASAGEDAEWDVMLRCAEHARKIIHLPRVLAHNAGPSAVPAVAEAACAAVARHLERGGVAGASASLVAPGRLRVTWPLAAPAAHVSIVIPTKDNYDLLRTCLESLRERTAFARYDIILVDSGSEDERVHRYYEQLCGRGDVQVVPFAGPFNYSAANNRGARRARGDLLLFLNNDVEVLEADWLEEMVRWAQRPGVGVVGAKLLFPDGNLQHAGVVMGMSGHCDHVFHGQPEGTGGPFGSSDWYRNYLSVTGACMMLRRNVFEEAGGFDEGYRLAFSDIELCLRVVRKGYRCVYTPYARLRHHEGGSRGGFIPIEDMRRAYVQMKAAVSAGDPYFNPNLSYRSVAPVVARSGEETRLDRLKRVLRSHEASAE